jgi:hypothetical protein
LFILKKKLEIPIVPLTSYKQKGSWMPSSKELMQVRVFQRMGLVSKTKWRSSWKKEMLMMMIWMMEVSSEHLELQLEEEHQPEELSEVEKYLVEQLEEQELVLLTEELLPFLEVLVEDLQVEEQLEEQPRLVIHFCRQEGLWFYLEEVGVGVGVPSSPWLAL